MAETSRDADREPPLPPVSVVVPVRDDPENLARCLEALALSDHPDYEVVVVDDASSDGSAEVAAGRGARVVRLASHGGPAAARNRGAEEARHPYLLFVDADVCVKPQTLRRVATAFRDDPSLDALFGSYDLEPGAPNVLSQYRNLMHHYVHQAGREEAFSFWSGCGAIRRSTFLELGGFDPAYENASIEDIELGARLRRAGQRVALVKDLQVKHMKRWTLWSMVKCDVLRRGIPWTLLLLREGRIPDDLNLRTSQRLSALCAGALAAVLAMGSWYYRSLLLVPLVVLFGIFLLDRWTSRGPVSRALRVLAGLALAATVTGMLATTAMGHNLAQLWALLAFALLGSIVLLNLRFYLFFARVKHPLYVPLVIPLHVLYFLYSGFAFAVGWLLHQLGSAAHGPTAGSPAANGPARREAD